MKKPKRQPDREEIIDEMWGKIYQKRKEDEAMKKKTDKTPKTPKTVTNEELLAAIDKGCEHAYQNAKELCERQGIALADFLKGKIVKIAKTTAKNALEKTLDKKLQEAKEASESIRKRLKSMPDMPSKGVAITGKQIKDAIIEGCDQARKLYDGIVDGKDIRFTAKPTNQKIITDVKQIVAFLRDESPDYQGRLFSDIVNCDDDVMEHCHDQVQWMFPLHEESGFAQCYPIVTKELVEAVMVDAEIRANLIQATERMQRFYGIGAMHYNSDRVKEWAKPYDHNLLRITRILRSLKLFGLHDQSRRFYFDVLEAVNKTGCGDSPEMRKTFMYWAKAWGNDPWETLRG